MSNWVDQIPVVLLAVALLVLPGLPVAFCLRAAGVVRLGVAIAVSLAIMAAASLLAPTIGMRWGFLPVLIVAVVVWIIAGVLRFLDRSGDAPQRDRTGWPIWVSVTIAVVGWVTILALGISSPANPSQLYDGIFHINAVEFIAETGDASPLHMTMVLPGETTSFYPTLWHAFVSLLVPVAGGVVVATNVAAVAVVSIIWPVAIATLSTVVFPTRPAAALWAPLIAFGFSAFPLGFLNWGVLYPNLIGTILIPILVALVVLAFTAAPTWSSRTLRILVAIAAAGAMAVGHPSALLAALALLTPFLIWRFWRTMSVRGRAARILFGAVVAVGLVVIAVVWMRANVTTNEWLPNRTLAQAFGETIFLSPLGRATGLLIGPLVVLGVWRTVKDRLWWVLASYGVTIVFFLVAAWMPHLPIRSLFVGVWYDDTTRVAALLGIWGVPLAGLGAGVLVEWVRNAWRSAAYGRVVAVAAIVAVAAASHLVALRDDLRFMRSNSFHFGEDSQGLSPQEADLFYAASNVLSDGSLVIGNPLTGAGLLYAYTGHQVVFPHITGRYGTEAQFLARHLVEGTPEVCDALENLGVTHAIDFGERELFENHYTTFDGLHGLENTEILTAVERVGSAVLYEATGCTNPE